MTFTPACSYPLICPNLTTPDLNPLKRAWLADERLTVACSERLEPLVAIYPVALAGDVDQLARSEDRSLLKWLSAQAPATVNLTPLACRNINTPEDLTDGPSVRI